jgi:ATP-dependent DNA helicase PIF1
MRVVLQANLDPAGGLVNGSQGTIIGFDPYDGKKMPRKVERPDDIGPPDAQILRGTHARYQEGRIKSFAKDNNYKPWPIVKFDNGVTKTIYADCTFNELGNEEPYSLLSRTQIPLMAGYACTVHKSQGMTLDRVVVDLAKAFEPSQIYVARKYYIVAGDASLVVLISSPVSRARSLNGLKVEGLPNVNLGGANPQVREFMESVVAGSK